MTTDNTRELDDLLQRFAMSEQQIGDELAVGAIQEETFDVRDTLAREKAKEAILDWHNKQIEEAMAKFHLEKGVKYDVKASDSVIVITPANKLKEAEL